MKNKIGILLLTVTIAMWHTAAEAQIRDNDASANLLAVQCAVSSGFSADDFEDYSRSLAKTLGMLSASQQVKVFGYLPLAAGGGTNAESDASASTNPPLGSPSSPSSISSSPTETSHTSSNQTEPLLPENPDSSATFPGSQDSAPASGSSDDSDSAQKPSGSAWDEFLSRVLAAIRKLES